MTTERPNDLTTWLNTQITADLARYRKELHLLADEQATSWRASNARWRVQDAKLKLRILFEHACACPAESCTDCGACSGNHHGDPTPVSCQTVRLLGAIYRRRDGYDQQWRPA